MTNLLKQRVALVTGSSRGIGAATARQLAQAGARVIVHANRTAHEAEQVARRISESGGEARVVQGDLSSSGGAGTVVRSAFSQYGALDILVNNAAVFQGGGVDALEVEAIDKLLAVNLRGVLLATSEFVRLSKTAHGRIVNISSIAARAPAPGSSLYAASKAAVESLTRSHAVELGQRGITVNAVAPGTTETEMSRSGFDQGLLQLNAKLTALGRMGRPDDIASVIVFLCSDAAAWITGQVLAVDGGQPSSMTMLRRIQESLSSQSRQKTA